MKNEYSGEKWKVVVFDFEYSNDYRLEVSNLGRVRTFNKISDGNILKGSMINGYKIIRLKFFQARDEKGEKRLIRARKEVLDLTKKVSGLKAYLAACSKKDVLFLAMKNELSGTNLLLEEAKNNLLNQSNADLKSRVIYYHALIHRLVAEYFITPATPLHTVVAHLDYNKPNNSRSNLKWMTPEENYLHQRFSPNVIASKLYEGGRRKEDAKSTKLSVTKVMLLKKLLNEGKAMRSLVKQFRVTETQILRIKRGDNWPEVQAAP